MLTGPNKLNLQVDYIKQGYVWNKGTFFYAILCIITSNIHTIVSLNLTGQTCIERSLWFTFLKLNKCAINGWQH